MRISHLFLVVLVFVTTSSYAQRSGKLQTFKPELTGQFPHVRDMAISPDGNTIYFTAEGYSKSFSQIIEIKKVGDGWSDPQIASFSGKYRDIEPAFTPDGNRLYFVSNRPLNGRGEPKDYDIWYVEKTENEKWGEPVNLGPPINTEADEFYPSVANSGTLYFTAEYSDGLGKEDIYMARWMGHEFAQPLLFLDAVNSPAYEFNAFIDPDERFIIFTSYGRKDELGGGDIFISQRKSNGSWTTATPLPEPLNSSALDYCPYIDFDNERFYFTTQRSETPTFSKKPLDLPAFLELIDEQPDGRGTIVSAPLKLLGLEK